MKHLKYVQLTDLARKAGENNAVARRLGADAAADAAMAESDGNIANSNNDSDDAELD